MLPSIFIPLLCIVPLLHAAPNRKESARATSAMEKGYITITIGKWLYYQALTLYRAYLSNGYATWCKAASKARTQSCNAARLLDGIRRGDWGNNSTFKSIRGSRVSERYESWTLNGTEEAIQKKSRSMTKRQTFSELSGLASLLLYLSGAFHRVSDSEYIPYILG